MPEPSVIAPLEPAWTGMRRILFEPFEIGKWFALGFSAWLANLGERGGLNFGRAFEHKTWPGLAPRADPFVHAHLTLILVAGGVTFLTVIAILLAITWVNARGKFMFLDNLVHDRALIAEPWTEFRDEGNSFFIWNMVFGLVFAGLVACLVAVFLLAAFRGQGGSTEGLHHHIGLLFGFVFSMLLLVLAVGVTWLLLVDFVVPVMYKRRCKAAEAWTTVLSLISANTSPVVLYVIFRVALAMGVISALTMAGVLTCCCGFVILAMPYINAVALLPVATFVRLYSLEFLRQFGPSFDVWQPAPPPLSRE